MPPDRLRIVVGLAAALGLAVLLAQPKVKALEQRFGVTVLISAGVPFLAMGAIFSLDSVGILTPQVLLDLKPAFEFGLGWVGFVVGLHFDVRKLDALPTSLGPVIVLESVVPMLTTAGLCAMALLGMGVPWERNAFARDALVLAACAAPSAPISMEFWERRVGRKAARMIDEVTSLDEVTGLALLGVVAILFRPENDTTRWVLPSSAWLLLTLGLGGVLGILTYVLLRGAHNAAEELTLLLGAVALSAGVAGYLALSVPVVCAIAGALLANLPIRDLEGLKKTLLDVERPIYLIFLLVVGATWRPLEWQGWLLATAFVLARVAGKRLGAIWSKRVGPKELPSARMLALALAPQSPSSIVLMVSAATLYHGYGPERVRWAINAVLIGGVLTEVVVRILEWRRRRTGVDLTPIPPTRVQPPEPPKPQADAAPVLSTTPTTPEGSA
ncbi:hypothetical protein [Polyangium mundeleinium]|uniref:Cation/H+ exchanger domain-containing protein n=1 Tax=Polyangium mundeleinium TaxID=2995306 RepID=A0ABT5EYQ0_9BACT|nr:hypothetical protein [Polyangium mundeleinium]MDC0746911.1 hypothetical protein [Polyangium mundeleinium]